jgi:hypothetical protein
MRHILFALLLVGTGCVKNTQPGTPAAPVSAQYRVQQGLLILADANLSTIQLVQALHKQGTLTTEAARDIQQYNANVVTFTSSSTRIMQGQGASAKTLQVIETLERLQLIEKLEQLQARGLPEAVTVTLRLMMTVLKNLLAEAKAATVGLLADPPAKVHVALTLFRGHPRVNDNVKTGVVVIAHNLYLAFGLRDLLESGNQFAYQHGHSILIPLEV